MSKFENLKGRTIVGIIGKIGGDHMIFINKCNKKYGAIRLPLRHGPNSKATIEDITGNLSNLLNSPILTAETISNIIKKGQPKQTFYKLTTSKGQIMIKCKL